MAVDDVATVNQGSNVLIPVSTNDQPSAGQALNPASVSIQTGPTSGTAIPNGAGGGTYTQPEVTTVSLPTGSNFVEFIDELNTDCQLLLEIPTPGCSNPCEVADIVINVTTTEPDCYGLANACIDLEVTGGNPPYNYGWSNGMTSQEICGLPAGNYEVTVTDALGCTAAASFTIDEPDETFTLDFSNATNATLGNTQATVTISDNDDVPSMTIGDITVAAIISSS